MGLVIGQVVDATTNRGVPHAIVRVTGPGVSQAWLTDAAGRYVVAGLPAGDYAIRAAKTGYFDGAFGQMRAGGSGSPLTLGDAEWLKGVDVKVWRPAVVDGFVVDEASEPVVGVRVQAWRREFVGGRRQLTASGTGVTDDEGAYRIVGLLPGEYVLSVPSVDATASAAARDVAGAATGQVEPAGPAPATLPSIGPIAPPPDHGQAFAYPALYYPGTPLSSLALPVELTPGQDYTGVFFQLQPLAAARVSGIAVGPDGPVAGQTLRLLLDGTEDAGLGSETAIAVTAQDGSFTFPSVPAGQYVLDGRAGITSLLSAGSAALTDPEGRSLPPLPPGAAALTTLAFASAGPDGRLLTVSGAASGVGSPLWGRTSVFVDGHDVDNVILTMQTAATISGRIEFDGKTPPPAAGVVTGIPILVEPAGSLSTGIRPGHPDGAGRFQIAGVLPGPYFVRVGSLPDGWFLESIMSGGQDVSNVALYAFASLDITDVVVTLTDTPTRVIGTVHDARKLTVQDATVLIFPAGTSLTDYGLNPSRLRALRPTSAGVYKVEGLPPGDYDIVAVEAAWTGDWRDPRVLEALRPVATRFTLQAGHHLTQDLAVVRGPGR